jgi:DNA-binding transcriptional MerR regulator
MATEQLTIGALAKATDTKVETIRYYERIGLLPAPARSRGNYRSYSPKQLGRLSFIRRARDLGFSLRQVRELLSLSDQRRRCCEAVDAIAREHLTEVIAKSQVSPPCAVNSTALLASAATAASPNAGSSRRFRLFGRTFRRRRELRLVQRER